ncbi:MAG: NUDIX hydrolase [Pseudomonadota bacterium]
MTDDTPILGSAYDAEDAGDVIVRNAPSPRPRDAATLILVRRDGPQPQVLMGKRSGGHAFMPGKYVFPGGRVDPPDGRVASLSELSRASEEKLALKSRRRPRAFALTAIRETFEETGLIVGKRGETPGRKPKDWQAYHRLGAAPCLQGLTFFGRAVTPPYRPKRFDARFFLGFAEDVLIDERPPQDGAELSDLRWVTFAEAGDLDLPSVTRFMIGEIQARLGGNVPKGPAYLRWSRAGHLMERL